MAEYEARSERVRKRLQPTISGEHCVHSIESHYVLVSLNSNSTAGELLWKSLTRHIYRNNRGHRRYI
jgi:hypothetical protein